jgi:predicted small metal-binding protein
MASFSCKNLGMDCSFEVTGTSDSEIMKKFAEHAEPAHNMNVLTADIIYKVQNAIKK